MIRSLCAQTMLLASLVVAIVFPGPATATLIVEVAADAPGASVSDSTANHPQLFLEKVVSGRAFADAIDGFAQVQVGPLPACQLPAACEFAVAPPGAFAQSEASGLAGTLKVRTFATKESQPEDAGAGAKAELRDTVTFNGPPLMNLHLDLTQFSGNSKILFTVFQTVGDAAFDFFTFTADDSGFQITKGGVVIDSGTDVPSVIDGVIDGFAATLLATVGFKAELSASSSGDGFVRADNTAFLGIPNLLASANGYNYPGFQAQAAVPEPGVSLLFIGGGLGLLWAIHRATRNTAHRPAR